jgi:LemA protein
MAAQSRPENERTCHNCIAARQDFGRPKARPRQKPLRRTKAANTSASHSRPRSREDVMLAVVQRRFGAIIRVSAVIVVAALLGGCGINTIPQLDEKAKAAWSDVLNQYQRRADLIPNLVETVKGYATQEEKVLTEVTEARAKATQVQIPPDILTNPEAFQKFQDAQSQLTGALGRLLAISEAYPDLKSNQNFLTLQSQLEGTENRISTARHDYINAVKDYNTELRTIPGRWWRALLYPDAKEMQNFTVAEETTKAPQVKF